MHKSFCDVFVRVIQFLADISIVFYAGIFLISDKKYIDDSCKQFNVIPIITIPVSVFSILLLIWNHGLYKTYISTNVSYTFSKWLMLNCRGYLFLEVLQFLAFLSTCIYIFIIYFFTLCASKDPFEYEKLKDINTFVTFYSIVSEINLLIKIIYWVYYILIKYFRKNSDNVTNNMESYGTIINMAEKKSKKLSFFNKKKEALIPENTICSICYEDCITKISIRLRCSHIFHIDCINIWFQHNRTCPDCRHCYTVV